MAFKRSVGVALTVFGLTSLVLSAAARNDESFKVRLSPVPRDIRMHATVTGKGAATAILVGTKLTISGSFEGLRSPATVARLHRGAVTGVRGAAFQDLTVSHSPSGTIAGSIELTPFQIQALMAGQLYIQIHSEGAPEGNLWGWLLRRGTTNAWK
jgi:hypothetical protein